MIPQKTCRIFLQIGPLKSDYLNIITGFRVAATRRTHSHSAAPSARAVFVRAPFRYLRRSVGRCTQPSDRTASISATEMYAISYKQMLMMHFSFVKRQSGTKRWIFSALKVLVLNATSRNSEHKVRLHQQTNFVKSILACINENNLAHYLG